MVFAFLVEEHLQVALAIYDIYRNYEVNPRGFDKVRDDVDKMIFPLEDDFHRWLLEFVPIAIQPIEPITVFARSEKWIDGYYVRKISFAAAVPLWRFFWSTRDLTYSVSLSIPYENAASRIYEVLLLNSRHQI